MKVTDVVIRLAKGSSKIKAFAVVTFDEDFTVNSFKVVEGEKGLFVASPSQRGADGKYYNTIRIKRDSEIDGEISEKVLAKYNEAGEAPAEPQVFEEPQ
ncbi:MAG: septation protein spoVG [Elusimicrobia bacterium CG08_land_8_20_14_0_20_44_26]|nr:MAG: septation protein spoVG [Elusimicrobia bacterium CG08_land_8_20_14_0_20_44_26]